MSYCYKIVFVSFVGNSSLSFNHSLTCCKMHDFSQRERGMCLCGQIEGTHLCDQVQCKRKSIIETIATFRPIPISLDHIVVTCDLTQIMEI